MNCIFRLLLVLVIGKYQQEYIKWFENGLRKASDESNKLFQFDMELIIVDENGNEIDQGNKSYIFFEYLFIMLHK